ncbi:MAG: hypothetical protein ABSE49_02295 [Polyangiaceae bacterium]|jgi:hypothetical protein
MGSLRPTAASGPRGALRSSVFPLLVLVACGAAAKSNGAADASNGASLDGGGSSSDGDAGVAPVADPCIEAGTCPLGQWIDVTPADMSAKVLSPPTPASANSAFGPGAVVGDPSRPTDLYIAEGGAGLWKSTDYGSHWTDINPSIGYSPIGIPIAVAGTSPATIWLSKGQGNGTVLKSTDAGQTFTTIPQSLAADLYSIQVDPNDNTHLISGLHEVDGLVESTDGGSTWHPVGGSGWPSGGISFYPFFINTGDATTTRSTWFAIAQDGAAPVITTNGGASWTIPNGLASGSGSTPNGLQHPHGAARLDQRGSTLFVAGIYGPGQGVYRSTDLGANWSRVDSGNYPEAVVWSSAKNVYSMYGWACSGCTFMDVLESAPQPGTSWSLGTLPPGLAIGPNSLVVTNDGTHAIFVGTMWSEGIWVYVEP